MGTRRDEALQAVDSFVSSLRTELSTALSEAQATPTARAQPAGRLANRLSRFLDLPPPPQGSSSRNRPSTAPISSLSRPTLGRPTSEIPFSGSSSHQTVPLPNSAPPTPGPSTLYPSASPAGRPRSRSRSPVPPEDDELPSYSVRAPIPHYLLSSLPPKRLHLLTSKSGKLALELNARGREHVVLIQEVPDGECSLDGKLKLSLPAPESITHVRVRLKGVIRTLVMKAHSSGRHPVSDEVAFLSSSKTLWTLTPSNGAPPERLRGNQSADPLKLHGDFSFPFSLSVPGRITHLPPSSDLLLPSEGEPLPRPMRPPPSFMLDSAMTTMSASVRQENEGVTPGLRAGGLSTGGFEASCRYYLKVTLGRKGLLKMNERWLIPIIFVPRQPPPALSPLRELALRENRRPPSSREDRNAWTAPGKYVVRESVRKGVWKTRTGWVEVEGRVMRGKVARGAGERVEFEVQITSSNPEATGRFPPSCLTVTLMQRTAVTAQRLTNSIDQPLLRATSVRPLAPPGGESVPLSSRDGGGQGWRVTYGGSIKLTSSIGSSFAAPNLAVGFLLLIHVYAPTTSLTPTQLLAALQIPVDIVSCAPRPPLPPAGPPPSGAGEHGSPDPLLASPPSPAAPEGTMGSPPPPLPPRKSPPTASSEVLPSLTATAGAAAGSSSVPPADPPAAPPARLAAATRTDSQLRREDEAERIMEDEWGLPPSYFDVVAVEGGRR
ncbi:hypothetical protein JCM8097_004298 [Rhodosporidiobolus ruineniae]